MDVGCTGTCPVMLQKGSTKTEERSALIENDHQMNVSMYRGIPHLVTVFKT